MSGVGIFGGTFDPIHLGHLRAAEEVREAQRLDEIRLIPSAVPPHKKAAGVATAAHRLRMVELALDGVPGFRVSRLEVDRAGPSYSVDTIRAVRAEVGDAVRVVFVVGIDAFRDFHTWKDHAVIFGLCDIVVVTRPPDVTRIALEDFPIAAQKAFCYGRDSDEFRHESGHVLILQRITGLDISAASIRTRVAAGRSIRFLVPPVVEAYIRQHGLYRRGDPSR